MRQSVEADSAFDLLEGIEQSAERRAFSRLGLQRRKPDDPTAAAKQQATWKSILVTGAFC
jgi:hypothetical protein